MNNFNWNETILADHGLFVPYLVGYKPWDIVKQVVYPVSLYVCIKSAALSLPVGQKHD